jgi:CheY-like chemotaxis protein
MLNFPRRRGALRRHGVANTEPIVALVVEDEILIRCALVEFLQDAGYQVLSAGNGAAALEILNRGQAVDVLVTDIRLGAGIDGWTVADAFRKQNANGAVIYVSGTAIEPARTVTESVFLTKPYAAADILRACGELAGATSLKVASAS